MWTNKSTELNDICEYPGSITSSEDQSPLDQNPHPDQSGSQPENGNLDRCLTITSRHYPQCVHHLLDQYFNNDCAH